MSEKIIVIGAGIGGLTSATLLQQAGYDVTVLEAQSYAGGCASTFTHKGFRFESGATVVGGFQPNGPHALVGEKLNLTWRVKRHDPAWVTHLPDRSVALTSDNSDVVAKFPHTAKFWEQQARIASIAWSLSAQGLPFPPRSLAEVMQLAKVGLKNFPRDLQIIPFAFSTVYDWLRWHNLHRDKAFVRFLDAQLLISAQTTTQHVNALYGATALDLARQGVYHIETGIGGIADTLIEKLQSLGGTIHYKTRVTKIEMKNGCAVGVWSQKGRKGKEQTFFDANFVIANTTPWDLNALLGEQSSRRLKRESSRRKLGWGAFVLHLGINDLAIPDGFPDHHQLITDMDSPLGETKSIFMSLSPQWDTSRAPHGQRAMTITTHTTVSQWWDLYKTDETAYYAQKEVYSQKILMQIEKILPNFRNHITLNLQGTPLTYQFYTDRYMGMVGGFPQTSLFKARSPRTGIPNIRLVGDSIFPGQSTAGVSLGAIRVADDIQRVMPIRQTRSKFVKQGAKS